MSKLHLLSSAWGLYTGRADFFMRCGIETNNGQKLDRMDFTNDISVMESLPRAKVCQNCMKAYRAQHGKGGA